MIAAKNISFSYSNSDERILQRVEFDVRAGDLVLLTGATGSGKSTLLKSIVGLVPHYSGGNLSGQIEIQGQQTFGAPTHEIAHLVGFVNQQPESSFATETVEEELAFGMEQLGFSRESMTERVQQLAEQLGILELLAQPLETLSGGQQQRVAIAAAIAAGQKLLLLDEPTSALDDEGCQAVLELLKKLTRDFGVAVILSEHRTERVRPFANRIFHLRGDGRLIEEDAALTKQPATIEESQLNAHASNQLLLKAHLSAEHGNKEALVPLDLEIQEGTTTVVTGNNGSGKTTLLWCLLREAWKQGIETAMVPQSASDILILNSVSAELEDADRRNSFPKFTASVIFEKLVGRIDPKTHPRDLSSGQQLALALAIQLHSKSRLIILDEPTRGLDSTAKRNLASLLVKLRNERKAIVLATHDTQFAGMVADFKMHLTAGQVAK